MASELSGEERLGREIAELEGKNAELEIEVAKFETQLQILLKPTGIQTDEEK